MSFKTFIPKVEVKADKKWYLVDAEGKTLGRIATEIANIIRGKNKPIFTPHMDMGDYVVVINANKVQLTGGKEEKKEYIHHTGYLGHLRRKPFKEVREKNPKRVIEEAVSGMLPKNRLRKHFLERLMIYPGSEHPHAGQNPTILNF
ncbi:50S ribosomal protein L13 [Candidatus Peregrinibacteria bacterium CG_4_10_14_0_2_um_filter_43_11]|nr:MAG: 50S ribosomal protein L13 [Candidatus Peregrinibacteria bacterium CG_4_10_14_0_2_um_filter_43_11]